MHAASHFLVPANARLMATSHSRHCGLASLRRSICNTTLDPGFAQNRVQYRVESMRHQRGFMTPESHQPLHCTYAQSSSYERYARPTDRVPGYFAAG